MLNDKLKKVIKDKKDNPNKAVNINSIYVFLSLGIRIMIVYLFFIFLGKIIANFLNINNLFFYSIILATIANIYIIIGIIKKYSGKYDDN